MGAFPSLSLSDVVLPDPVVNSVPLQDIPEQLNGCDCGVFTCKYAEYVSQDKAFDFDQGDMPYFRRRMIWEMINKTLL